MKILTIIGLGLLLPIVSINAQDQSEQVLNRQRSIFLFNIAQQLRQKDYAALSKYEIGILGSQKVAQDIIILSKNRTILSKPIEVKFFRTIEDITPSQLIYVNQRDDFDISHVLSKISGKKTLLVGENYGFNQSMVNILVFGLTIEFELNEARLEREDFIIPTTLKDQAISSSERWQELYLNTERELAKEREKVNEQSAAIKRQQEELVRQQEELEKLETISKKQRDKLNEQYAEIATGNDSILQLKNDYEARVMELNELEEKILDQEGLAQTQQLSLIETQHEIAKMDSVLAEKVSQIEQQKGELVQSAQELKLQQRSNILLFILVIVTLVSGGFILAGYLKNRKNNKKLIALNDQKNELIGVVAHDLRSPINQVKGLANIMVLTETNLDNSSKELLDKIIESCDRLTNMIKRILDVNAIESNKINLAIEKVNLKEMMTHIATNFQVLADEKKIEIHQQYPESDIFAVADRNYLLQVLENIISNAIKFSDQGKDIHLTVDQTDGKAVMSVKDEGPGISEQDQKKLFGEFTQLTAKPTRGEHSSGLGLSIAKKYIEAMQGKIKCISQLNEGTTFQLQFQKA